MEVDFALGDYQLKSAFEGRRSTCRAAQQRLLQNEVLRKESKDYGNPAREIDHGESKEDRRHGDSERRGRSSHEGSVDSGMVMMVAQTMLIPNIARNMELMIQRLRHGGCWRS